MDGKTKRFVIEYANYKIDEVEKSKLTKLEKNDHIRTIDDVVFNCIYGYRTIDETMRVIANIEI